MDLSSSIRRFADYLGQVGLELSAYDMLDLLWLALRRVTDVGQPPAIESEAASPSARMSLPGTQSSSATDQGDIRLPSDTDRPAKSGGSTAGNRTFPLHADQPNPDLDTGRLPLAIPWPPVLPAKLELARVLRPLRRWVPLHHRQELDEAASVQRIAETGSWLPVLRPQTNRWLDVVLVVDTAPAMLVWQRTINELQRVLERSGVFRDVRRWHLGTDDPDTIHLTPMGAPNDAPSRNPRELIDPNGRRLILVVSDFVAPAWHAHPITQMLASLAAKSSLALIQVLPYRLWERSALGRHPEAILRARWSNTASAKLLFQPVQRSFRTRISGVPVPVAGLDVESVATLAQLVAGRTQTQHGGVLLQTISAPFVPADKVLGVEELLANWKLHAAEESIQLLRALAVVPLSAPIMHLIHHQSVAVPRLEQMVEVLLSGLIRRDPTAPAGDAVTYRFIDGAREILQRELPVGLGLGLLRRTSEYIATCDNQPNHFRAMLVDPASIDDAALQAINPAFATVAASYLKRLGGRYAEIGQRMEGHEAEDSPLNSEILIPRLGHGSGSRTPEPTSPNPRRNSYFSTTALGPGNPAFRGRTAEMKQLLHLCHNDVNAYGVIYGGRQNGKTSLLLQLAAALADPVRVCRVDFQKIQGAPASRTFSYLAAQISNVLPAGETPTVSDAPALQAYVSHALAAPQIARLVLLLDELGALPAATRDELGNALRSFFHERLVQPPLAKLLVIFSSGIELYDMVVSEVSSLRSVCEELYLSDLAEPDAITLIADGLCNAQIDAGLARALGRTVYERVTGHPYLTQRIGALLEVASLCGETLTHEHVQQAAKAIRITSLPLLSRIRDDLHEHNLEDAARRLLTNPPSFTRLDESMARLELIGLAKPDGTRWAPRNPLLADIFRELLNVQVPEVSLSSAPQPSLTTPTSSDEHAAIITAMRRRLALLERIAATHGSYCPPQVTIEIEDMRREIAQLTKKQPPPQPATKPAE